MKIQKITFAFTATIVRAVGLIFVLNADRVGIVGASIAFIFRSWFN